MSADGSGSKYLIFTDSAVYQNTDSWLFTKFNSADVQGHLKPDSTYTVKVAGWRVPVLSIHRNIVKIEK